MEQNGTGSSLQVGEVKSSAVETNSLHNLTSEAKATEDGLDKIFVKPMHRLEREKMKALEMGNNYEYRTLEKKKGGNSDSQCEG
ncbi:hypothetical protein PS2_003285 [Malus domestica]